MNRLILIGNGFDLAHGLKTSYHDFILDYLKNCLKEGLDNLKIRKESSGFRTLQSDDLIEIRALNTDSYYYDSHPIREIEKIKQQVISIDSIGKIEVMIKSIGVNINYKGDEFAKSLFNELITKNWVDIESIYYQELKKIIPQFQDYKSGKNRNDHGVINRIRNLNEQLDFIKTELGKYLNKVYSKNVNEIRGLKDIIHKDLEPFVDEDRIIEIPGEYLFLNFNYTTTPNIYLRVLDEVINIHGELNEEKNPIIFGYGDEVDKFYEQIEDLNENEFFKHIKSFDYFKTHNYTKLLGFLKKGEFEVFIMGHSCGVSDRTMLSTIFEDDNCISIKIFDYRDDKYNYRDKTYEISRHFKDKKAMRKKIVPFNEGTYMPQAPKLN